MRSNAHVNATRAVSPNFERMVRLVTAAAVGSVLLVAGMGAFAQTSSTDKPTPAQKQPAKPGSQSGEQKLDGSSSPQYAPRRPGQAGAPESTDQAQKRDAGSGGTEKTPAKSGAQGGKEPASK